MAWDFYDTFRIDATLVSNTFIDRYMAGANGEYVKIYLYLLRHQSDQPDAAVVAEELHYTEGDVRRAIAYWGKMGVLARGREEERLLAGDKKDGAETRPRPDPSTAAQSMTGVRAAGSAGSSDRTLHSTVGSDRTLHSAAGCDNTLHSAAGCDKAVQGMPDPGMPIAATEPVGAAPDPVPVHSQEQVSLLADDEDFAQLLYIAQKYMNKVFTQRECQVFAYLYGGLGLSSELLEYLVEYCVQNGHTSIRYMETVALNWHKRGLVTVEEAKAYCAGFSKDGFAVMKAFGLNDRRPAEAERRFIDDWFGAYGFTREVVLEACDRTIQKTHSPSFQYADKILKEWKKAGVKNLSDVEELDKIYQDQEKKQAAKGTDPAQEGKGRGARAEKGKRNSAANRFHNFEQSATDYDSLMIEKVRARMKK